MITDKCVFVKYFFKRCKILEKTKFTEKKFSYFFKKDFPFSEAYSIISMESKQEVFRMAKSASLTGTYEALPKIAKILIQLILGGVVGGIYRIVRFFETGNIVTLVVGILFLVTGVGNFIAWVIDLVTEITSNRITVLAD